MARTQLVKKDLHLPLTYGTLAKLVTKLAEHDAALDKIDGPAAIAAAAGVTVPVTLGGGDIIALDFADAATATYTFSTAVKIEIIDCEAIKDAAGAANTIQLKNGAGTAISDAMAFAVDKTVSRAATMDKATRTIAAGGTFQVTVTRAAGSGAGQLYLRCRPAA